MPAPILTLTTDFGLSDHYVGTMKGVILGIYPRVQLVDLSHLVAPYAIAEGAFVVAQAYRYFPRRTVHLVVVDPGVGSARRPIVVEAAGQFFVAPDNGVLGLVFAREKHKVRLISNSRYFLPAVSQTFHGRDLFAPVAAHLAAGVEPARVGPRLRDYVRPPFEQPREIGPGTWEGRILKVDRFGNVVTNFAADEFPTLEYIAIGRSKACRLVHSYAEAKPEELVAIAGSSGYLELSLNQGSAAEKIGCRGGDACQIGVSTGPRASRASHKNR